VFAEHSVSWCGRRGGGVEAGREEGGEGSLRRRKSWSTDQPLQYIAGEDGKLVPVRDTHLYGSVVEPRLLGGRKKKKGRDQMWVWTCILFCESHHA
jgi:hypothetical protein